MTALPPDLQAGQFKTFTGRIVTPWNMTPEMVDITDIAHSLSRINRFYGHTAGVISVGWHSIRVATLLWNGPKDTRCFALEGLLHDASETYLGDVARPVKNQPEMQPYRAAEFRCEVAIATALDLVHPWPQCVKDADMADFHTESSLGGNRRNDWLVSRAPDTVKSEFLAWYHMLTDIADRGYVPA